MTAKEPQRNTDEFKHFKLHSDSTLESLTKRDLIDYIHMLYHNWQATDESYLNVMEYAGKLSANPPLKFEELHEGIWVWDDHGNTYTQITKIKENRIFLSTCPLNDGWYTYRDNRFYRRQKEE